MLADDRRRRGAAGFFLARFLAAGRFWLAAFFFALAFFRATFLRPDFFAAGFFFAAFFLATFFLAGFFFFAGFFCADVFRATFLRAVLFLRPAVAAFFLVTFRFLAADFFAVGRLDATFFLVRAAFFRFLLADFFAGIFDSSRTEKRPGLYMAWTAMEAYIQAISVPEARPVFSWRQSFYPPDSFTLTAFLWHLAFIPRHATQQNQARWL